MRLLKESFSKHAGAYTIAILAMLIVAGTTAASAWIMRDVTNEIIGSKDLETINLIALIVGLGGWAWILAGVVLITRARAR